MTFTKIQSRVNIFIHAAILSALTIAVLVAGYRGWNKITEARNSVTILQKSIEDNKTRLSRGKTEFDRASKRNQTALTIMKRLDTYKKHAEQLLKADGAEFKRQVDAITNQHKLNTISFEAAPPGSQKLGNYTYDGRTFTLTVRGTYRDVGAALASLENKTPLMEVLSFNIVEDPKTPKQLVATMSLFVISDIQEARVKSGGKK